MFVLGGVELPAAQFMLNGSDASTQGVETRAKPRVFSNTKGANVARMDPYHARSVRPRSAPPVRPSATATAPAPEFPAPVAGLSQPPTRYRA